MSNRRFKVKFCKKAAKEYEDQLNGSMLSEINEALDSLEERADQVGKQLGNKRCIDLTGSKEKKLASSGIRIIYVITNSTNVEILTIVEVLLVAFKKNETDIYEEAERRLNRYRTFGIEDIDNNSLFWKPKVPNNNDIDVPTMIDQIFDETFDDIEESIKMTIIEHYSRGDVQLALEIRDQCRYS